MSRAAVRSTLYMEPALHQALRLKAATGRRSMSEIVNDAVRAALREDVRTWPPSPSGPARRLSAMKHSWPSSRPMARYELRLKTVGRQGPVRYPAGGGATPLAPSTKPSSDRIAVKVINQLGDEVMKVFRVQ